MTHANLIRRHMLAEKQKENNCNALWMTFGPDMIKMEEGWYILQCLMAANFKKGHDK